jgi:hypothetical protein
MRLDETRQHQPAGGIDLGALSRELRRYCRDFSAGYADIDRFGCGPRPGIAEDDIEGGSRVHGGNLAEAREKDSSRLCAVRWQNCSKYVHAI